MPILESFLNTIIEFGLFLYIMPFILLTIIVFVLLQHKVILTNNTKINMLLSITITSLALFHGGIVLTNVIKNVSVNLGTLLVPLFGLMVIFAVAKVIANTDEEEEREIGSWLFWPIVVIAILTMVSSGTLNAIGINLNIPNITFSDDTFQSIAIITAIIGSFYFIHFITMKPHRHNKKSENQEKRKRRKSWDDFFKEMTGRS